MNNSLISVIMPVKNGANYMAEAIAGIQKQNMNLEIIVVNDCSDDNTEEIATNRGCKVINNPVNVGNPTSRNRGLKAASGDFILFHDHDDVMREGALKQMYAEFEKDNELQVVTAKVQDFFSPEIDEEQRKGIVIKEKPYRGLLTGAVLIKKEVFDIIGTFDENLRHVEGVEFQMRFQTYKIKTVSLDIVSTDRRIHNSNAGRNNQGQQYHNLASIIRAKRLKLLNDKIQ
jgi:glycosyltransferase involved in cell wall biosynthesis